MCEIDLSFISFVSINASNNSERAEKYFKGKNCKHFSQLCIDLSYDKCNAQDCVHFMFSNLARCCAVHFMCIFSKYLLKFIHHIVIVPLSLQKQNYYNFQEICTMHTVSHMTAQFPFNKICAYVSVGECVSVVCSSNKYDERQQKSHISVHN